jgi:hypothetical protein
MSDFTRTRGLTWEIVQPIPARATPLIDFIFGDPYEVHWCDRPKVERSPRSVIVGLQTYRRVRLRLTGTVESFVIFFQPPWYCAILCGVAMRETLSPHTSEWGFSMKQKKAGYASQRRARMEGRDPAAKARHCLKFARARGKREKEAAEERKTLFQIRQKANERYIERVSVLLSQGKALLS